MSIFICNLAFLKEKLNMIFINTLILVINKTMQSIIYFTAPRYLENIRTLSQRLLSDVAVKQKSSTLLECDQSHKTRIWALWWRWTVLSGVSRCKQFRFESVFKTSKAVSRSSVYRWWVPDGTLWLWQNKGLVLRRFRVFAKLWRFIKPS